MKKIYFLISLLLAGIIGLAYLYFTSLDKDNSSNDYGLEVLSSHSGIIVAFDNDKSFFDIMAAQEVSNQLLGLEKSVFLQALLQYQQEKKIANILKSPRIYMAFQTVNTQDIALVLTGQLQDSTQLLKQLSSKSEKGVYKINLNDSTACFLQLKENTFLISDHAAALHQAKRSDGAKAFAQYIKKNSRFNNNLAMVFINFNKIKQLAKPILKNTLKGNLKIFDQQDAFARLNYNYASDKLLLSGPLEINSNDNYYTLFNQQENKTFSLDQSFPKTTANYVLYQISEFDEWQKKLALWQDKMPFYKNKTADIKRINDKYRLELNKGLPKYFNHQFATMQLANGEKLALFDIKNGDKLAQSFLDLSSMYSPEIRIFKERNLLSYFFGQPLEDFSRPFYSIIDNLLIVANYPSSIQQFLNTYRKNEMLTSSSAYTYFKDQSSNTGAVLFYINLSNSKQLMQRELGPSWYKRYKANPGFVQFDTFAFTLSADGDKFSSNLFLLKPKIDILADSRALPLADQAQ